MSQLSNFLENAVINHLVRNTAYSPVATLYVALFNTNPNDDASGTEVSGGGYARQVITFGVASGGAVENDNVPTWTASGASFGTVAYFAIFDALTSGNMLHYAAVTPAVVRPDGSTTNMQVGDVTLDFTDGVASGIADTVKNSLLNLIYNNTAFTSPTTVYVALASTAFTAAGAGTELTGNGYARQSVTFAAPSNGQADSNAAVQFTASGGDWVTAVSYGLFDAVTTGNQLFQSTVDTGGSALSVTVTDGGTGDIASGDLFTKAA